MKTLKSIILVLISAYISMGNVIAQHDPISFEKVPATIEEFVELRNKTALTPEGGCAMFVLAMLIYKDDIQLGKQCFVVAIDRSELRAGNIYKGFDLVSWETIKMSMNRYPLIAKTYVDGSSPENGYTISLPYVIKFGVRNASSGSDASGKVIMFVICSGADNPKPITMIKNNKGLWKASKHSSLFAGMKTGAVDDDL